MDGGRGDSSGLVKRITFIVYFITIVITSAPPQIIRYETLEAGDTSSSLYRP